MEVEQARKVKEKEQAQLAEQNAMNDMMVLLKIDLRKLGDRAYHRLKGAPIESRLQYLGAMRIQAAARSFLVRLRIIRSFLEEASAIQEGINEVADKMAELRERKERLMDEADAKRKKAAAQQMSEIRRRQNGKTS